METYEKKYKEALEKARQLCAYPTSKPFISDLQDIFPELKGSEDEDIRKSIIGFLITITSLKDGKTVSNEDFDSKAILKWVAWLEKQGTPQVRTGLEWVNTIDDACDKRYAEEYAHGEYYHEQSFKWGFQEGVDWLEKQGEAKKIIPEDATVDSNDDGLVAETIRYKNEKQGEQKPVWSEEDEKNSKNILYILNQLKGTAIYKEDKTAEICIDWLKNIKERVQPQPKQEWSEEDESMLQNILECLRNGWKKLPTDILKYESWLKSLRPQSQWKPSEEQIVALKHASNDCSIAFADMKILATLYEQLKALHHYEQDT